MGAIDGKTFHRYGFAVLAVAVAVVLRLLLDPLLNDRLPFFTLLAAVILTAALTGRGPATAGLLLGLAAAVFLILVPRFSFAVAQPEHLWGAFFYAVIGAGSIVLFERLRAAQRQAEERTAEARQQYQQLQAETDARQQAQAAVLQERERLRVTLASIGDGVITTDCQGRVAFLNDVAQQLTGWTQQDAQGLPLENVFYIIDGSTRHRVANPVDKVLRKGLVAGLVKQTVLVARDGSEHPIDDSAAPIRNAANEVIGAVLIFRDVSEQRRSEQGLRISEARKSAILETALDCIIMMDHEGKIIEFNPAAERTFGYSRAEVVGRELAATIIPPSLREQHKRGLEHYLASGEGPVLGRRVELPALRADGSEFPVELAITRIPIDGPPLFTAYLRDISERKRSEQHRNTRLAVTHALAQAISMEEGAQGVLRAVCENLGWDLGFFWSIDPDGSALVCRQSCHRPDLRATDFETASRSRTFPRGQGLPGHVWASGETAWILDVLSEENFPRAAHAAKEGLRSAFALPVLVDEQSFGVMEFFTKRIREPDADLLELMESVAGNFGHFLERRHAEEQLREQTLVAETLNQIGMLLAAELDLDKIVQAVTDQGTKLTSAEFGAFFYNVLDHRGGSYTLYTLAGIEREAFAGFPMPRNTAIFNPTFEGQGVVRLSDITQDPRFGQNTPYHGMPHGHLPVKSYLAVPVISRSGNVLGGLFFGHSQAGVFTERHEQMMIGVAAQAAIAIDNAQLYQQTHESDERFRQLAEHIHNVFWMADPHAPQVLYVSPAYERIWGRTRQSLYNQPRSFLDSVHPEDQSRVAAALERQAAGEATTEEYRVVQPDGSVRWVLDRAFPIRDASGQVYRVAGIAEDIHERKHAEQSSRFLAEASTTLASVVDFESTLQEVANLAVPAFADYCAVDLLEPGGGLRRLASVHVDAEKAQLAAELYQKYPPHPDASHGVYRVLRSGEPEFIQEIGEDIRLQLAEDDQMLRMLRSLALRSFICVPLQTRNRTLGTLSFAYAESGRRYEPADLALAVELVRRAAIAIENAGLYHELKEADRRKDEFLATLAHELRNPLAPIRNGLQVMQLVGSDNEIVSQTRLMMERQLNQMVRLVDDLLDVSRITRNKLDLRKQPVDLASIIHSAVETSRPLIEESEHDLTLKLPDTAICVEADATRLAQVFSNLLNNSAKYTERGGQIWLTAEQHHGEAIVSVRDNGIGIPAEALPSLFQMFSQVDRHLERAQGGLGIGLTLVRRLVEMHRGSVEVHSEGPGHGSEFIVRLPVLQDSQGSEPVQLPDQSGAAEIAKRRILIVDDNHDSALSLGMMLKLLGNQTRVVHDGHAAIEAAAEFRPDMILLDIGLPKLNGYDTCRRIREQAWSRDTVIIALTGWGQEEDRRRSAEAGFDHHLVKPVEFAALEALLAAPVKPFEASRERDSRDRSGK